VCPVRSHFERERIISMFKSSDSDIFKLIKPFAESYPAAYGALSQARPLTCTTTGTTFDGVPAPVAVIMDVRFSYPYTSIVLPFTINNQFFAVSQLQATRKLSAKSVPVIAWITGGASTIIRLFGPEERGGLGDFGAKIDAEAGRTGKRPEEIGDQVRTPYLNFRDEFVVI